ncbi:unnamed protein product [Brassica napus]|uniref:Uncharacterized protein n=2 Tax=Brassica TaxID=3705 RepID=M4EDM3_BRACM|nr:unnamed protein product [Brassica napus]
MKNKQDNARKRKTNTQPIFLSPSESKSSDQTNSDIGLRSVLRDVTNLHPTLPSSGSTQNFTHPSTAFNSANPYYDKAKGKQPQCSKRFRANGGDYNNKASQLSDITRRRSTCLNIQPRNLLPAFSKSDSVKQRNPMEWPTSQLNEAEEEDDFQSSVNHSSSEEGEYYSDQSYDVSSEDSDSYEVSSGNIEGKPVNRSPIPDEQRSRVLTMADIFRNMFQGGESSSTTPSLQTLKTTGN